MLEYWGMAIPNRKGRSLYTVTKIVKPISQRGERLLLATRLLEPRGVRADVASPVSTMVQ